MNQTHRKCVTTGVLLMCGAAFGCGGRTTLEQPDPAAEVPEGCWTVPDELLVLSPEELRVFNVRTRRPR